MNVISFKAKYFKIPRDGSNYIFLWVMNESDGWIKTDYFGKDTYRKTAHENSNKHCQGNLKHSSTLD